MTTPVNPLSSILELIEKGKITKDIGFEGTLYTLRSLNDEEYSWRDQFLQTSLPVMALFTAQRGPTLAIATVAINGVNVEDIPEFKPTEQQAGAEVKYAAAYNLRKFYAGCPQWFIEGLYDLYMKQVEIPARKVTEAEVKNS